MKYNWLQPIIFTLPVLSGAFLLFQRLSQNYAKAWDIEWGYYAVLALFVWFCAALAWNAKEIFHRAKSYLPSKVSGLCLAGLLVLFAVFAVTQIDLQHRVLSDETSWESMALEMRFNQSGGVCNQGVWKDGALECRDVVNNFKGKAFAFVQSIAFLFAEPNRETALRINLPLALASVALLFFAMFRFTKDEWLALAAAIFLASQPIFLMQSRSASTEVLYVFLFTALLAFYSIVPPKEVSIKHFALIIPLLGFFAQTRQETLFCFIPFVLFYHSYFTEKPQRLAIFTALTILASWPSINTMIAYRGYDFQGGEYAAHSLANFIYNLKSNITIMLNTELDPYGLLKNPFYTTYTLLLFLSSALLIYKIAYEKKYRWAALLFALFCLQIGVILFNVSGTFEIDINQRYVLVALPLFAIVMATGLCSIFNGSRSKIICGVVAVLAIYLSLYHKESFNKNILYNKNKLLAEEDYLNTELKKLPKNSIFIYARPWQMLASGFNGFNERQFLGWSPNELDEWRKFSEDNIYLVRGQDGYGEVNRKTRVVGFKTTSTIDEILNEYKAQRIFSQARPFGYALEAYKIGKRQGESNYAANIRWNGENELLEWSLPDTLVDYKILLNNESLNLEKNSRSTQVKTTGMHYAILTAFPENDTVQKTVQFFIRSENNSLLQDAKMSNWAQDWGDPKMGKSVENNAIKIDRRIFEFGIGSHAKSKLVWNLNGAYKKLHSYIGLDDESACGNGAIWVVKGNGKELYRSKVLTSREIDSLAIDISGVNVLELETLDNGDKDCDHANWAGTWIE
ncbi:MAG: NPCBM/NEW2 domain-containing protein [Fibromonadaceae bacterium]|jgi:4-amino-4-deoxy-L-arabinose transferase-like glycosyltransferase|nr:NPCBM/NEW2 domain-containing protein [Fibromonadaceae bacterium]